MLALAAAEGFPPRRDMRLYLGSKLETWRDEFLAGNALTGKPYAILAPTARWMCKCWPLERFTEIGRRLLRTGLAGPTIVVLAAPRERPYIQPLLAELGALAPSAVICPTTSVGQMMALISTSSLVVCNDSAPQHLAVGFDRPLVAVFGPTDPQLEGPVGRPDSVVRPPGAELLSPIRHRHQRHDQSLIAQVTADAVWQTIEAQMRRSGPAPTSPSAPPEPAAPTGR